MPIAKNRVLTSAELDAEMDKFDKLLDKTTKAQGSPVKLRAAERDLLGSAEILRDFYEHIVKGNKEYLLEMFKEGGSTAPRFARVKDIVKTFELSDMNRGDQRWGHLSHAIVVIEEILEKYGCGWKGWTGPPKPPQKLGYRAFDSLSKPEHSLAHGVVSHNSGPNPSVKRLTPGVEYTFAPEVKGCTVVGMNFTCSKPLPQGLVLDATTGVVRGSPVAGKEVAEDTYVITGKNGAGSTEVKLRFFVADEPPWNLKFDSVVKDCFTGEQLKWQPKFDGGAPTRFSCKPALPAGVSIDSKTGLISGRPLKPTKETAYTIEAGNSSGTTSAQVTFGVGVAPPTSVDYPDANGALPLGGVVYLMPSIQLKTRFGNTIDKAARWGRLFSDSGSFVGTKWGKARKVLLGTVVNVNDLPDFEFSVTPALPAGLELAKKTGVISGTPTVEVGQQLFKVTCKNDGGEVVANVPVGVKQVPPSQVKYPEAKGCLFTGTQISLEPEVNGPVDTWEIEPALPAGLTLDRALGTICGIPTEVADFKEYTVSASNTAGQATSKLTFCVQKPAPEHLVYKILSVEYPVGRPMDLRPTVDGEVDEFTIEPALPAGLELDKKTGVVSGSPDKVADSLVYTIVAKNDTGTTTATVAFSVKVVAPESITYPRVDDVYGVEEPINLAPEVVGGATKWSVEPALPAGVVLDEKTGEISGCAAAVTPDTDYTITAENEAGGASTMVSFRVASRAPEGLTYPGATSSDPAHKNVLQVGQEVSFEPALTQDLGAKFSIDKPLPPGLSFDPDTGKITGSPTETSDQVEFTVTAKNKAGETQTKINIIVTKPPDVKFQTGELDDKELADRISPDEQAAEVKKQIDLSASFIKILEECTRVEDLPGDPDAEGEKSMNWMYWIVHRLHLNDPTLDTVDFVGATMPLPHIEPRIAPKMMKALHTNTHCKRIKLSNTNVQKAQGAQLAEALKDNKTLELVDVQSNFLDSDKVKLIAEALTSNLDSAVCDLKIEGQHQHPTFGRCVEEALAKMCQTNIKIVKLSCTIKDPHWQNTVNNAIMKNNDAARRARKKAKGIEDKPDVVEVKAVKRNITKVVLDAVPNKEVYDVFDDDNPQHFLVRLFMVKNKTFPTKEQLQKFSSANEKPIKFKDVAAVIKGAYALVFNSVKGGKLTLFENTMAFTGDLAEWTEKNDRFTFDLWPKKDERYMFSSDRTAPIEVSDAFAQWLAPQEKRLDDGTPLTRDEFAAKYGDQADEKWASGGIWK